MDYKIILAVVGIILAFVGYGPYIADTLRRKTKPYVFTWFVWTLASAISSGLQLYGGAGTGAWSILVITFICFIILVLSFRYGSKEFTKIDVFCLILAIVALGFWLLAKQPVLSAFLIVSADVLGFVPAIRKSWKDPHSETLWAYQVGALRYAISIGALQKYNILTLLHPSVWTVLFLAFSIMLVIRRRVVKL